MNSRRAFFSNLIGNFLVSLDELRGRPQLKLLDLQHLPDDRLARIIPRVNEKNLYYIAEGKLWAKDKKTLVAQKICEMGPVEQKVFERFSESKSLGEISRWVVEVYHVNPEEALRMTRELFLELTKHLVCFPTNNRI